MRVSTIVRLSGVVAAAIIAVRCGSSSPSTPTPTPTPTPTGPAITTLVTGVQAPDGTAASQQSGTPPAASGGPAVTATATTTVINGGSDVVRLQAATAFQTVYVSVSNATGISPSGLGIMSGSGIVANRIGSLAAASGFWQLRLAAPTTDTLIIETLGRTLGTSTFTISYAVATASGSVGATVNSTRTVNTSASTGDVQVSVSWNTASDVDLHVVDPRGDEVYWNNSSVASGGKLDLDSNAGCALDNKNNENIRWPAPALAGTYTVRVDYWSACAVTGTTTFAVTVNNGGVSTLFNGSFTANQADNGGGGSGRTITTFNHTNGITSPSSFELLGPKVIPSPLKLRLSGEQPRP